MPYSLHCHSEIPHSLIQCSRLRECQAPDIEPYTSLLYGLQQHSKTPHSLTQCTRWRVPSICHRTLDKRVSYTLQWHSETHCSLTQCSRLRGCRASGTEHPMRRFCLAFECFVNKQTWSVTVLALWISQCQASFIECHTRRFLSTF